VFGVLFAALSFQRSFAEDGEGSARIEPAGPYIAGSTMKITLLFQVGPSGIPVGGGVALGLHDASHWTDLQISDPNKIG